MKTNKKKSCEGVLKINRTKHVWYVPPITFQTSPTKKAINCTWAPPKMGPANNTGFCVLL